MSKKIIGCILALMLMLGVCACITSCDDDTTEGTGSSFEELV